MLVNTSRYGIKVDERWCKVTMRPSPNMTSPSQDELCHSAAQGACTGTHSPAGHSRPVTETSGAA